MPRRTCVDFSTRVAMAHNDQSSNDEWNSKHPSVAADEETNVTHAPGSANIRHPQPDDSHVEPRQARRRFSRLLFRSSVASTLLIAIMSILYLAPRLIELDQIVTVDERFWLGRSANFYAALAQGDFEDTYQHAHPGVTVMWAGTLGFLTTFPEYKDEHPEQMQREWTVHEDLRSSDRDPLDLLMAGRVAKLILQAVIFAIGLWLALRVFGVLIATVGGGLLAFDPFLIAHDRLLHIDGMVAVASFASIMALLRYLDSSKQNHLGYLALSGSMAALAWLTRVPALLLLGIAGAAFVVLAVRQYRSGTSNPVRAVSHVIGPASVWGLSAIATTLIIWPALLVAPRHGRRPDVLVPLRRGTRRPRSRNLL